MDEYYFYLVAVSKARRGAGKLVQDDIVHYSDPDVRVSMLERLNLMCTNYLQQAEDLAHFAQ